MSYAIGSLSVIALVTAAAIPDATAAESRAELDLCEAKLSICYEKCKATGTEAGICNDRCSTDLCGLYWRESYGSFIDRRIEENSVPQFRSVFIGLSRLRKR